jgi:peptidoglycan/LPS O-acetylase OafA/YrhL
MRVRIDQEIGSAQLSSATRIIFANQLRGLAAVFVMLSHFGWVFILMSPIVSGVTSSPELHIGHPAILYLTSWRWMNFGPFGVGIFFLISGFVIPLSLRSHSAGKFLIARGFRIFPTFWIALLIEWLAVFAQSRFYGRPMAFSPFIYVCNASLIDTTLNNGYVDLVNWTLAIEVKFYILMAILRPWILRGRVTPLICVSVVAFAIAAAERHAIIKVSPALANEPMFIGFMLIGTLFHYRMTGLVSNRKACGTGSLLIGLFLASWGVGPAHDIFEFATNYIYALIIFWAFYAARARFRPIRYLDFLADISYPLYLIHSVIGFSIMVFIIEVLHGSYALALPCGLGGAALLAYLLHRTIERPIMKLGKKLSKDLSVSSSVQATQEMNAAGGP